MLRGFGRAAAALPLAALLPFGGVARAEAPAGSVASAAVAAASLAEPGPTTGDAPPPAGPIPPVPLAGWTLADPQAAASLWDGAAPEPDRPIGSEPILGPPAGRERQVWQADTRLSFGQRFGTVKWETLGLAAYITAINLPGLLKHPSGFSFEKEGFFGKDTANLGMDKVAHSYNAAVLSDILYGRMKRQTGASAGSALASSVIALGLDVYSELFDAFEARSGFSFGDVGFNVAGAGFSFVRNTVPGLKEKLDFRLLVIPNRDIYSISNKKEHFRQERFILAVKLAGFGGLARTPLRFLELHAGYYAKGFTDRERARGAPLERKPFFGFGINLSELLFPTSRSTIASIARTGLEYLQVPYTAVQID